LIEARYEMYTVMIIVESYTCFFVKRKRSESGDDGKGKENEAKKVKKNKAKDKLEVSANILN